MVDAIFLVSNGISRDDTEQGGWDFIVVSTPEWEGFVYRWIRFVVVEVFYRLFQEYIHNSQMNVFNVIKKND